MVFYEPVLIDLTDEKGNVHQFTAEPFVAPYGEMIYRPTPTPLPIGPVPSEHGPIFPISPVKLPLHDRPDIDTPLLGAPGLHHFGLGLDTKSNCLYSLVREFD